MQISFNQEDLRLAMVYFMVVEMPRHDPICYCAMSADEVYRMFVSAFRDEALKIDPDLPLNGDPFIDSGLITDTLNLATCNFCKKLLMSGKYVTQPTQ